MSDVLSPTSTRGAARTAARLVGALGAALAAACSAGADEATGKGAVVFAPPLGPTAGIAVSVTPGPTSVVDVDSDAALLGDALADGPELVTLRMPVTVGLTSYGMSAAEEDDPFLDEVAEVSACLALLLRQPRSLTVGATAAVVEVPTPGRSGFVEDREGSDRYTATWTTAIAWTVAADPLPELGAVPGDPFDSLGLGDPVVVDASTAG